MATGIPEFDMVLEASRHLQEIRMKRRDLQERLEDLAAEEEFWLTHLYLRLQSLDSAKI